MIVYSIILFAVAILFIVIGVMVYNGRTDLIHSYHQARVKDKRGYGCAMGKALAGIGVSMAVSGVLGLFTDSGLVTAVLIIGMAISLVGIVIAQIKYNGGIF